MHVINTPVGEKAVVQCSVEENSWIQINLQYSNKQLGYRGMQTAVLVTAVRNQSSKEMMCQIKLYSRLRLVILAYWSKVLKRLWQVLLTWTF